MNYRDSENHNGDIYQSHHWPGSSALLLLLTLLCCGCSTMNLNALTLLEKKPEYKTPLQVIPIWSNTVLHQAGRQGTRGFGGRVIFYGENKEKAVRVDGSLVVYAWDDTEDVINRQADRKYVFKAEKLQDHYSDSKIGHSYNFWLPWDVAGGDQERISLIIRFIGSNGAEVTSEPTTVILPGPIKKPDTMTAKRHDRGSSQGQTAQGQTAQGNTERNGGIVTATHQSYSVESTNRQDASYQQESPSQQVKLAGYRTETESRKSYRMQTSEIALTSGFIERNLQGKTIGFSSEDLFAPEEHNTVPSGKRSYQPEQQTESRESTATQPSTRSQPFQSRVRTSRSAPQFRARVRTKPLPAKSLNGLPKTPRYESRVAQ